MGSFARRARPAAVIVIAALAILLVACGPQATPTPETVIMVVSPTPGPVEPTAVPPTAEPPTVEPPTAEPPTAAPAPEATAAPAAGGGLGMAGNPITNNALWTPVVQQFNGIDMVLVPTGCYMMGYQQGTGAEIPAHEQCFDQPFWIAKTETTNAQYGSNGAYAGLDFPRNNVTWKDATTFCTGIGMRLPTEREWEYAARGPNNNVYPWGNDWLVGFSVNANNAPGANTVASIDGGKSWVGAYDMAGNLREWTSSIVKAYPYDARDGREDPVGQTGTQRVVRGGSYLTGSQLMRSSYREWYDQGYTAADIGFRCAMDYQP